MQLSEIRAATYNTAQVLADEADEIAAQCAARGAEVDLCFDGKPTPEKRVPDRLGLAFSGGGIRSACIALGIVQGLAKARMLNQVHYISGISGGGYTLGWLTAWISRQKSLRAVEKQLGNNSALGGSPTMASPPGYQRHVEPFPLHYLRRYTSYLAPRAGLLSGDTLAMISIYLRNILLNQTLLACAAVALMMCLQTPAFINSVSGLGGVFLLGYCFSLAALLFVAAFVTSVVVTAQSLHRLGKPNEQEWYFAGHAVMTGGLVACASLWLLLPRWYMTYTTSGVTAPTIAGLCVLGGLITLFYNRSDSTAVDRRRNVKGMVYMAAWSCVALLGVVLQLATRAWLIRGAYVVVPRSYAVFGLPAVLLAFSLLSYLWVGIVGNSLPDGKREWLARAAGYFLAFAGLVALVFSIAFYGPVAMHLVLTAWRIGGWRKYVAGLLLPGGWIFTVAAGLIGARSNKTSGSGGKPSSLEALVGLAPPVFLLGVLLLTSWASSKAVTRVVLGCTSDAPCVAQYLPWADWPKEGVARPAECPSGISCVAAPGSQTKMFPLDWAAVGEQPRPAAGRPATAPAAWLPTHSLYTRYALLFLAFLMIAALLGWRLDVNEFSLHLFYRNRLVRAFLGASRPEKEEKDGKDPRRPSPFTGFAPDDDIFLRQLTTDLGFQGPYPIWGTCLNLTTGEDLAWQQRKGASFIYSPLFCGWDYVNRFFLPEEPERPDNDLDDSRLQRTKDSFSKYGYRSTRSSSDNPKDPGYVSGYGGEGGAPLIGTAMAASGAAISPNSGYHSKPGIAALLALFNLRLGWWAGNPRHPSTWMEYAPPISYLVSELLGEADDRGKYVYLSDGGHFENLGLYELVRRRVRFIICSDADADPAFAFGDLGNAIDHCRRDFGVEIKVEAQQCIAAAKLDGFRSAHYALGKICYPGEEHNPGLLLFIKSSLTSDEPSDVLGMKARDKAFPHDTTLNQFFNESMFESYRALGQHMFEFVREESLEPKKNGNGKFIDVDEKQFQRGTQPTVPGSGDSIRKLYSWLVQQRDKQVEPNNDPTDKLVEAITNAAASFKPEPSGGGAQAAAERL